MADDVTYQSATPATPPSGTVIATDEAGSPARQYQLVKLVDGTVNSETPIVGMASQPAGTEAGLVVRPASVVPDVTASGTIDATDETVSLALQSRGQVIFLVSGTFTITLLPELSFDGGSSWTDAGSVPLFVVEITGGDSRLDGITSPGQWLLSNQIIGATHVRLRGNPVTSGAAVVAIVASGGHQVRSLSEGANLGQAPEYYTQIAARGNPADPVLHALVAAADTPASTDIGLVTREAARGQATMAASIPVVLADDQSSVAVTASLAAGNNNVGDVDVASIAAGDNNIGNVDVVTVPAPLSTVGGGLESTALRVTLASDSTGVITVKQATATNLKVDASGVAVPVTDNSGSLTVDAPIGTPVNVQVGNATLAAGVVDETGTSAVDALAVGGGTPHDSVDSGNPIKLGVKAASAFPTAVAANDRANVIGDLWGRPMVTHIDPAQQVHKAFNATSTQTGVAIWDPTTGKKIAVTSVVIGTYGTTAGRVILWFGDNGDTSYTAGTDQLLLAFSTAPSASSKPGLVFCPAVPVFCTTADRELHITTDANVSIDVAVEGYEF